MLEQIERRYNAENDTRPDGPPVTWAEMDLYDAIKSLTARVEKLEVMRANVVDALENHHPDNDLAQAIWSAVTD